MNEQSPDQADDPYVFVSYDKSDASKVREEIAWLRSEGINFWYKEGAAYREIPSEDLGEVLNGALKVLFFVSEASMASETCRRDVAFSSLRGLEILQVFLDEGGLTDDIRDNQHLGRVFQSGGNAAHRTELARALKERIASD